MIAEDFDKSVKIIIVGNGTVGKSSLILRFCNGDFTLGYKKTIGVDFVEKIALVPREDGTQEKLNFLLWDTAGQEEFASVTRSYYRGAGAALIVFSVTDRASFEAVPAWHEKVMQECGDILTVVVQNKVDLEDRATVTPADIAELQHKLSVPTFRTSVKDNLNVEGLFNYIASEYLRALIVASPAGEDPAEGDQNINSNLPNDCSSQTRSLTSDNDSRKLRVMLMRTNEAPRKHTEKKSGIFRRTIGFCISDQM